MAFLNNPGARALRGLSIYFAGRDSAKNENGEPFPAPRLKCLSLMPWQRPRGVASGAHRKSGVVLRLTSACPVESFLPRSAYFLHTTFGAELQVHESTIS